MKRSLLFSGVSAALLVSLLILVFGSKSPGIPPKQIQPWKTGYWIWSGQPPTPATHKSQVLYVQVQGTRWPRHLPEANEYFVVRRIEPGQGITKQAALKLVDSYKEVLQDAGSGTRVTGLQIDYDSPTSKLSAYADFLEEVRRVLPSNSRLSITALLDWFGTHTAVEEVLGPVDEFVPQFYDAGSTRSASGIAEPIDVNKWAPILNAQKTPYRIGISSFGRIARQRSENGGRTSVRYFRDASPMDFADRPDFRRSTSTTRSGELVVRYDVHTPIQKYELLAGDRIEITFPTEVSVSAAYDAARRFGGYCAGVIFFRWPNRSETLALSPDEVGRILNRESPSSETALETRDGFCVERHCSDLYLHIARSSNSTARLIGIRALGPMELFLPAEPLRPVANSRDGILVRIPAYSGLGSVYLGRAISNNPIEFEVRNP